MKQHFDGGVMITVIISGPVLGLGARDGTVNETSPFSPLCSLVLALSPGVIASWDGLGVVLLSTNTAHQLGAACRFFSSHLSHSTRVPPEITRWPDHLPVHLQEKRAI